MTGYCQLWIVFPGRQYKLPAPEEWDKKIGGEMRICRNTTAVPLSLSKFQRRNILLASLPTPSFIPSPLYNHWHSVRTGDRILAGAGANNNLGDLARHILARWGVEALEQFQLEPHHIQVLLLCNPIAFAIAFSVFLL